MKELTIEDKAKRYDEAIKIAKEINNEQQAQPFNVMTRVFPELKESEGDRIINNIKKAVEYYWSDESLHEILDWLEKQSKNNMGISEATKQNLENNLNKALEKETPESCNKFLDEQGEQKPAIKLERDDNGEAVLTPFEAELFSMMSEAWQGYSFGEEVNIAKIVKEHSKELLERANEQKPAWNEEDEKLFRCAIDAVKQESKVRTDGCLDEEVGEMVTNWLKSLKERVQPQPKQEWSEEDEEMYNEVLTDIIYAKNDLEVKECLGLSKRAMEAFNWFSKRYKSLRPQNTWKPSDEQMQALCSKLPLLTGSGNEVQRVLETLYCDLKKLRNE